MSWGLRSDCKHLSVDVVAATQKGHYGGQLDTFTKRAAQYPNDSEQNVSLVWVGELADKIRLMALWGLILSANSPPMQS